MAKRFIIKNKKIGRYIFIIFLLITIYYSFILINKTEIKNIIIKETIKRYDNSSIKYNFSDKLQIVFNELNKVVNYTDLDNNIPLEEVPDIILKEEKPIDEVKKEPIIYIYNTHQTESYSAPYTSDYTITPTVYLASNILAEYLLNYGIYSIIENNSIKKYLTKHNLKYTDSYEASRFYAKQKLEKYESIEYIIDIHRDSPKLNKTLFKKDEVEYAKIMFVVGQNHANYKKNLEFVKKLNNLLNEKYNGISRGIYTRKDTRFNQDLKEKAILIELGGYQNTLEQVNNSAKVIAEILNDYIKGEE